MTAPHTLFKFCTSEGAKAVLSSKSIFITSPLDLNDPFEMRPAWTDEHERRHIEDQEIRNSFMENAPVVMITGDNRLRPIMNLPKLIEQPPAPVANHRGIADTHHTNVFSVLHARYRVLSFATGILDAEADKTSSGELATLLWSHYADSFQGICLAFDPTNLDNGMKKGGYAVDYSVKRVSLSPDFYDVYRKALTGQPVAGLEPDEVVKFLTRKSPAWKYEQEVRMIYDLNDTQGSERYSRFTSACASCQTAKKSAHECDSPRYRDTINFPPSAVQAVIIGTDTSKADVEAVLQLLRHSDYDHVRLYWSSLHSDKYQIHYSRDPRTGSELYTSFIQGLREKQIATAKNHLKFSESGGFQYIPSKKTVNFCEQS